MIRSFVDRLQRRHESTECAVYPKGGSRQRRIQRHGNRSLGGNQTTYICLDWGLQHLDQHSNSTVEPNDVYDPECFGLASCPAKSMLDCSGIEPEAVVA